MTNMTVDSFNWRVFKQLWPYLIEFKLRVFWALICLVLAKVASVYLPFLLKAAVDSLSGEPTSTQWLSAPLAIVAAYGVARLFNVLLGEVRDTLFGRVTERAMRRIGLQVFEHLHQLDLNFHLNRRTGGLARDIERGSSGISFLMRFMIFNIVPTFIEILFVVGILFINYGISFAAITFISVVIYIIFSAITTEWRTHYVREANLADSSTNSRSIDSLLNYETVKFFNNEAYESQRYDDDLAGWELARRKNRLSLFALNGGQALIIASAMTLSMGLAAYGVEQGTMTIGDFVLINAFMLQIFMPLNFLGFVYREIKGSLANIENLFALLKKVPQIQDPEDKARLLFHEGEICFEQVYFNYNTDRAILQDVSFTVKAGEKVAIVGESGSGKSTLIKLLFRFYDPSSGRITIDGQNINHITQQSLRQVIGIVPQDTVLFNDTLWANIEYGRPEATTEEINQAIDLASLRQFINSLPQGAQTEVGERGLKLSGGEKQRVSIARTILKNPPILALDEATSSLDSESEQAILQAFRQFAHGHTSIVIAHRLSTIIDADKIIVLQQGKIIEVGSHHELLQQQGVYTNLWLAQQKSHTDSAE